MRQNKKAKNDKIWIELSRSNLRGNLRVFRSLNRGGTIIWTVKANAYGHGASLVAREIQKTITSKKNNNEWFGVDSVGEAIILRQEGITIPIIVLGWVPYSRLKDLEKNDLRLLVSSPQTVNELKKRKVRVKVHLKIDTGTTRQGVLPANAATLAAQINSSGLVLEGIATHFANIEDVDNPVYADLQMERFVNTVRGLHSDNFSPPLIHAACSAAALTRPESLFSACRIGIGLYGLYPSPLVKKKTENFSLTPKLRPVLSWYSRVALVKKVPSRTPVGYGLTELTKNDTVLALVPIGYADGYPRALSGTGRVIIRGKYCRIVGRICMNMLIVDAGNNVVKENDQVTLIGFDKGKNVTVEELAEKSGTINYEIVARLAEHLPRYLAP
jgi:alanine racemase